MVLLGFPNAQPNLLDRVIPIIGRGGFTDIFDNHRSMIKTRPIPIDTGLGRVDKGYELVRSDHWGGGGFLQVICG